MTDAQLNKLRYPIGPFAIRNDISSSEIKAMIDAIAQAPAKYAEIARDLSDEDLGRTYRDGSWNVQQLFNHVADMQMLHFLRMKRALTESDYKNVTLVNIEAWTKTPDGLNSPIADSLLMIEGITKRFVHLMKSLDERQLEISYYHTVRGYSFDQKNAIALTAWHVRHHLEHIRIALGKR